MSSLGRWSWGRLRGKWWCKEGKRHASGGELGDSELVTVSAAFYLLP